MSGEELESMEKLPLSTQLRYFPQKIFQKSVLNSYTQISPKYIRVNFNHKPQMEFSENLSQPLINFSPVPLYYNLSHTEDFSVMALATREIGVDLEKFRPVNEKARLNPKVFSKEERQMIKQDAKSEASCVYFWKLWTLKEAFLKWLGLGLQSNLSILPRLNFIEKQKGVHILQNQTLNLQNPINQINSEKVILLQNQINSSFIVSVCASPFIFSISEGKNSKADFSNFEPANFHKQTLKIEKITPDKIKNFEFTPT